MTVTTKPTQTRTSADRILDVFRDFDSATPAEIVATTGLSKTTVSNTLKKLADAGDVIRMDRNGAVHWALTPARKAANKREAAKLARQAAKASVVPAKARKADEVTAPVTRTPTGRRAKGVIDAEIIAFLRAHEDEAFGSYAVANGIGSSKGAAYVALNRMDRDGTVVKTQTEPDRYALPS